LLVCRLLQCEVHTSSQSFSIKYNICGQSHTTTVFHGTNDSLKNVPYPQCSTNNVLRALKRNKLWSWYRRFLKLRNGRYGPSPRVSAMSCSATAYH